MLPWVFHIHSHSNPPLNLVKLVSFPFYRKGNWGQESWSSLPRPQLKDISALDSWLGVTLVTPALTRPDHWCWQHSMSAPHFRGSGGGQVKWPLQGMVLAGPAGGKNPIPPLPCYPAHHTHMSLCTAVSLVTQQMFNKYILNEWMTISWCLPLKLYHDYLEMVLQTHTQTQWYKYGKIVIVESSNGCSRYSLFTILFSHLKFSTMKLIFGLKFLCQ